MEERFIYTLSCPVSGLVRYVGQTNNLKKRYYKHLYRSKNNPKYHSQCWINGLMEKGLKPLMEVISICDIKEVDFEERFYISIIKSWGFDLTNLDLGGSFQKTRSSETKKKVSESLKGKRQSEETKNKRSVTNTEVWKDETLRQVQRERGKILYSLGVTKIGIKGKPSGRKGMPYLGDKGKLSDSLKKYFLTNNAHNKKVFKNLQDVIDDYNNLEIPLLNIAKKYSVNRTLITKTMKDNGIELRNNGKKIISKDTLIDLLIKKQLKIKEVALYLNCSESNVDKFKNLHKVSKKMPLD